MVFTGLIAIGGLVAAYFLLNRGNGSSLSFGSASILAQFSKDLTRLAQEKKLDPVIGRRAEILRAIQILSRRTKNNPVLIGKAGIGKTAIAEGLALAIISRQVPPPLFNKRVLALDLVGILAGTKYRGEFEQRLKKIVTEIVAAKRQIILFIDEIHILAEAGEAEGAINAADILKPLLARGELQVVGATTGEEYNQYIKNDKTLDRRLQPIFVAEPTPAQTAEILNGVKKVYEDYHQVEILPAAIKAAIVLTKNIKNRSYPDKAIDALDEACSKVRINYVGKATDKIRPKVGDKDVRALVKEWQVQT